MAEKQQSDFFVLSLHCCRRNAFLCESIMHSFIHSFVRSLARSFTRLRHLLFTKVPLTIFSSTELKKMEKMNVSVFPICFLFQ